MVDERMRIFAKKHDESLNEGYDLGIEMSFLAKFWVLSP